MEQPRLLVKCRRERPTDRTLVHVVEAAAFRRESEAALVDALRAAGALALSAVAEMNGRIVGHIAFSPAEIVGEGRSVSALALAPMAVHPEWQRQGVGSALIQWSLEQCRKDGHGLVIVLGHPEYYPRFGFVPAQPLGVRCPFDVPDSAFLLLELQPGYLGGHHGTVRYRPEFAEV